jgi:tRNA modification GTPase
MSFRPDTIFALSSGRPPAAIAVVRISGPKAKDAVLALAGKVPEARRATLRRLKNRSGGDIAVRDDVPIDDAVVLWFPGPRSETGEDTAEFQLHGGAAVVAATLAALGEMDGLRPAEPGEFTRRAFENGRLDLTRVEGLADLIGAETEAQRRQAYRQLRGVLGDRAETWRRRLTEAIALVEAAIDFPDEGIVAEEVIRSALTVTRELEVAISDLLVDSKRGERLREGLTVTIAGPVNAGKSSVLNRLAKRPAAIVSPHAGTTRDVIEVHLDLGGFPVTVLDTAGIRETHDPVEEEGVRRALERAGNSDLVLWVVDATLEHPEPPAELTACDVPPVWMLLNKIDLVPENETMGDGLLSTPGNAMVYRISARTGESFDDFVDGLADFAISFFSSGGDSVLVTRERHRAALSGCADALRRVRLEGEGLAREDIIAEELHIAARELGRLVGRVDVESVLDVIFREFCIGK